MMETEFVVGGASTYETFTIPQKDFGLLCPTKYRANSLPVRKFEFKRGPTVVVAVEVETLHAPFNANRYPNLANTNYTSAVLATVWYEAIGEPSAIDAGLVENVFSSLVIGVFTYIKAIVEGISDYVNRCNGPYGTREYPKSAKSFDRWEFVIAGTTGNSNANITHIKTKNGIFKERLIQGDYWNMPEAGAEVLFCNDGTVYTLIDPSTAGTNSPCELIEDDDHFIWQLDVIGDTGGADVNTDNDCGCDSRIDQMILDDIDIYVDVSAGSPQYNENVLQLSKFYCNTNGQYWTNNSNWFANGDPCTWYGVSCDGNGNITELNLSGNNLSINGNYLNLPNIQTLTKIDLSNNYIESRINQELTTTNVGIPEQLEWFSLSKNYYLNVHFIFDGCQSSYALEELYLGNIGTIENFGFNHLPNLAILDVSYLSSGLDSDFFEDKNFPSLFGVGLASCGLERFPSGLTDMETLAIIALDDNSIDTLPDDIIGLENLVIFSATDNTLDYITPSFGAILPLASLHLGILNVGECVPKSLLNNCNNLSSFELQQYDAGNNIITYSIADLCTNQNLNFCEAPPNTTDNDGDGYHDLVDCDDNDPYIFPLMPGVKCDDGNSGTLYDVIGADGCTCAGVPCDDLDGDGLCQDDDCNDLDPNVPGVIGECCDDGNPYSYYDHYIDECNCSGDQLIINPLLDDNELCQGELSVDLSRFSANIGFADYQDVKIVSRGSSFRCGREADVGSGIYLGNPPVLNLTYEIYTPNGNYYTGIISINNTSFIKINDLPIFTFEGNYVYRFFGSGSFYWEGLWTTQPVDVEGSVNIEAIDCGCTSPDTDGDGTCDDEDCDINNPNLPGEPGTLCDLTNTTINIIGEDGCTCYETTSECNNPPSGDGTIYLYSQADVDAFFTNYDCPNLFASIYISGSDIQNLDGLSGLLRIFGDLTIVYNPSLTDMTGLDDLIFVQTLSVLENIALGDISFNSLQLVNRNLVIAENELTQLTGFPVLERVFESFELKYETSLSEITGFASLTDIYGSFSIIGTALESLDAFANISLYPSGLLLIQENQSLTACNIIPVCFKLLLYNDRYIIENNDPSGECLSPDMVRENCTLEDICLLDVQTAAPIYQDRSILVGQTIEISSLVNNNANVLLDAGDCIELKPDFSVDLGSTLHAKMDGCGNN